ncbi:MAG: acyl-CoA carboxylase subunit beta [Phycisphaerales bacterium]
MSSTETINPLRALNEEFQQVETQIRLGGGPKAIERQHERGRMTARERIEALVDSGARFTELGLWAGYGMYKEHGGAPASGVVTGVGPVHGKLHMVIANDATVKAGAFFPMTCKKIIRAQMVAQMASMPLIYLVDSAGVYLPLQEDVFPDTDDFGRIFRNNAVISASGIPQYAAIMGFCVAGGGYLPVLCDTLIMTEGSGLYLAGPALVKAAIGQEVSDEELGGASMHAAISGTIDFKEPDDEHAIERLRSLVGKSAARAPVARSSGVPGVTGRAGGGGDGEGGEPGGGGGGYGGIDPARPGEDVYRVFTDKPGAQYDIKDLIACVIDGRASTGGGSEPDFDEYKAEFGQSMVCGYARIRGMPCGIVANQGRLTERTMPGGKSGPGKSVNMPRVLYTDAADKAARFIMDCNQRRVPLVFVHDTTGFMVGRDSEQEGIIRCGAKMVNAMSNCVVPKIVLITGSSYGAGNYAMCGRAFDPFVTLAWPGGKCAVMGAAQATGVLAMIEERSRERKGETIDAATHKEILDAVRASYSEQQDIRHGAARGWVDRIIQPHETREELSAALEMAGNWGERGEYRTGVFQV